MLQILARNIGPYGPILPNIKGPEGPFIKGFVIELWGQRPHNIQQILENIFALEGAAPLLQSKYIAS